MANIVYGPGPFTAAFLIREAHGMYRSREEADVLAPQGGLQPGTILGTITGSGVMVRHAPGASDGSQNVSGILWEGIPPFPDGDTPVAQRRTVVVRDAEVHKTELIYSAGATAPQITAADTALRGLGIIPRL